MRRLPIVCSVFCTVLWILGGALPSAAWAEGVQAQLAVLRKVEKEGKGNQAATAAWAELVARSDASQLPVILGALDGAGPLAANWIRSAADAVAERELQKGKLTTGGLEQFLADKRHDGRARRMAFEWIARADTGAPDRLIPRMLDDPSLELRRDAVARVIAAADKQLAEQKNDEAARGYRQAIAAARDLDQIKTLSEALKKLGQPVNLAEHFGFLLDWKLVGPFDNHAGKGFDVAYPPERAVDLKANYETPAGSVSWIDHHTDDEYGMVDLNKAIGKHMGAAAYAVATFQSDRARPIELRLGCENANKIWLNGRLLSLAEVYHANGTMDQYVGRGELKAGQNLVLLKICQNEQKEDWAQDWKFQLRVCDELGTAVLSTDRPAPKAAGNQTAKLSQE